MWVGGQRKASGALVMVAATVVSLKLESSGHVTGRLASITAPPVADQHSTATLSSPGSSRWRHHSPAIHISTINLIYLFQKMSKTQNHRTMQPLFAEFNCQSKFIIKRCVDLKEFEGLSMSNQCVLCFNTVHIYCIL